MARSSLPFWWQCFKMEGKAKMGVYTEIRNKVFRRSCKQRSYKERQFDSIKDQAAGLMTSIAALEDHLSFEETAISVAKYGESKMVQKNTSFIIEKNKRKYMYLWYQYLILYLILCFKKNFNLFLTLSESLNLLNSFDMQSSSNRYFANFLSAK